MVALRPKLVLLAAAVAAFGLSLAGSFHFDDYLLLGDPVLAAPSGAWEVFRPLQSRPLAWFTFWINRQLSATPFLWHLFSLTLHLAAVWFAWRVLRRLLPEAVAFPAVLLFAVHPIQAQAVAYIYARAIVLATLLALIALDRWLDGHRWQAVAWFAAALLAKEEVAAFPVFLALLETCRKWMAPEAKAGVPLRRAWPPIAAMLALSLAAGARVVWAASVIPESNAGAQAGLSPLAYLGAQGAVLWRYARLVVLPWGFTVDPDIPLPGMLGWLGWLAAAVVLGLLLSVPKARGGALWMLGALVLLSPSSSFFPAADLAADRRLYFPLLAVGAAVGFVVQSLKMRRWLVPAAGVAMVALSINEMTVWKTENALWTNAVRQAPNKIRPRIQLSRTLQPAAAVAVLDDTKRLAPQDATVATELGKAYLAGGHPELSLSEFGRALAMQPGDAMALNNRGAALLALGQTDAAIEDFRRALSKNQCLETALHNLHRAGVDAPIPTGCRWTPEQRQMAR